MFFKNILTDKMGSLSYIIGCNEAKVACVVNPKTDICQYLDIAGRNNLKITHIFETPDHVDHLSGKIELKFRTGAKIYCLEESDYPFVHNIAKEGDIFEFGSARLDIINSPKYEPFSTSIMVTDKSTAHEPWMVLTRKSLFIGELATSDISGEDLSCKIDKYLDFKGMSKGFSPITDMSLMGNMEKSLHMAV